MTEHKEDNDRRLSAVEFYYYNLYRNKPESKALLISKDVHFPGLDIYPEEIVEMLKLIISLHPIAHTGFETVIDSATSELVVKRKILKIKHALDCYLILNLENKSTFYQTSFKTFDLENKAPVKFVFTTKPNLIIRFIFHRIGFDNKAVDIFVHDFITIMKKLALKETIPDFICAHSRTTFLDLDRYLLSNFAPLAEFWKQKLSKGVSKASFSRNTKMISMKHSEVVHTAFISFTTFTSRQILDMTIRTKTSILSLVVSVYQLILSFYSGKDYVTVVTEADLRKTVSGADNLVESMTNTVPLTVKIPKKETSIETFLFDNEVLIDECLSMAAFPFHELSKFVKKSNQKNLIRHRVVERNPDVNKDSIIYEDMVTDVDILNETSLQFIFDIDRTILNLHLQASSDVYSSKETNNILQNVAKMLRFISSNSEISISLLRDHILNNKHFIDLYGMFWKVSKGNIREHVDLYLTIGDGKNNTVLQWTSGRKKNMHAIGFDTVSNIHLITVEESRGLWIKTIDDEEYKFFFTNHSIINDWIQRFELILNFSITQV